MLLYLTSNQKSNLIDPAVRSMTLPAKKLVGRFSLKSFVTKDMRNYANRVFKSGKGSFDLIMQNVRNFKARHPSYVAEHVQFNTVINPKTNPSCFDEFFSVSSVFQDTHIMFNEVASSNVKENSLVSFGENYRIKRKFEFLKLFMSMSGKLDERYVSRLVKESKRSYYDLYKELRLHTAISSVMHPQGPCIPGIVRLFVNVNGEFFPCEKVPELAYSYKCFPFTCSLTTAYSFISNFPLVSAISKSRFRGRAMIYGHDEQIPPDY